MNFIVTQNNLKKNDYVSRNTQLSQQF